MILCKEFVLQHFIKEVNFIGTLKLLALAKNVKNNNIILTQCKNVYIN